MVYRGVYMYIGVVYRGGIQGGYIRVVYRGGIYVYKGGI